MMVAGLKSLNEKYVIKMHMPRDMLLITCTLPVQLHSRNLILVERLRPWEFLKSREKRATKIWDDSSLTLKVSLLRYDIS